MNLRIVPLTLMAAFLASPALAETGHMHHHAKPAVKKVVKHKAAKKAVVEKAVYTCPMHPEVKADKPGDCPKCGMHLEKQ